MKKYLVSMVYALVLFVVSVPMFIFACLNITIKFFSRIIESIMIKIETKKDKITQNKQ